MRPRAPACIKNNYRYTGSVNPPVVPPFILAHLDRRGSHARASLLFFIRYCSCCRRLCIWRHQQTEAASQGRFQRRRRHDCPAEAKADRSGNKDSARSSGSKSTSGDSIKLRRPTDKPETRINEKTGASGDASTPRQPGHYRQSRAGQSGIDRRYSRRRRFDDRPDQGLDRRTGQSPEARYRAAAGPRCRQGTDRGHRQKPAHAGQDRARPSVVFRQAAVTGRRRYRLRQLP